MMERKIKLLANDLINRIAAGEVIESPASVVKELVENSIDAGSRKIRIEAEEGGLKKIRVDDDGGGMNREDAILSIERHATSKISTFEDLVKVGTMGFRGEALASIASISLFRLFTAMEDGRGTKLFCEGGEIKEVKEEGRFRGTSVEVNSLFYNVPVRRNFQKSIKQLGADIVQTVQRLALSRPNVGFDLLLQGKEVFSSPANDGLFEEALRQRAGELFGASFEKELRELFFEEAGIKIRGCVGSLQSGKKNRSGQFTYINSRSVFSSLISSAVKEGYGTFMDEDLFPVFILHCELPLELVDVNVHPQKSQVALREAFRFKALVSRAVFEALKQKVAIPSLENVTFQKSEEYSSIAFETPGFKSGQQELFSEQKKPFFVQGIKYLWPFYLLEVGGHPLFDDGMVVMDIKSALSRVFYESLKNPGKDYLQSLAVPLVINLLPKEVLQIEEWQEEFLKLGVELRIVAKDAVAVDAIPAFIAADQFSEFFFELLKDFSSLNSSEALHILKKKRLAHTVCRFSQAIKSYDKERSYALFLKLMECEEGLVDPLGRPTVKSLKGEDFKLLFSKEKKGE